MQSDIRTIERPSWLTRVPRAAREFAAWVAQNAPEGMKLELVKGRVEAVQAGTSRWHNRICRNIVRTLEEQLDLKRYEVMHVDFAVETGPDGIRYPDVMVVPFVGDDNSYSSDRPLLLVEVTSAHTTGTDFTVKLNEYAALSSLKVYVICSQDEPRIWYWKRQRDKSWPEMPEQLVGRDRILKVSAPKIALALSEIYANVPVDVRGR